MKKISHKGLTLGLYDSDTGETVRLIKAVDLRPESKRSCFALFGRAKRGLLVQLLQPYNVKKSRSYGSRVHFFVGELGGTGCPIDEAFDLQARLLGMSARDLKALIDSASPDRS